MAFRCIVSLLKWTIIIGFMVFLIHFWISSKEYLFSHEQVAEISKRHVGAKNGIQEMFTKIHQDFQTKYPGHILGERDQQWIFVNAGGWMGSMCLLHASLTEYVLFFGTPLETSGHSGRYWANITDTVLIGEFHVWEEGTLKTRIHKPGDTVPHAWGDATAVNFKANTWVVEYGRGFIPSTLGFALADTVFSTQDFLTLFYVFKVYAKGMFLETAYYMAHTSELFG